MCSEDLKKARMVRFLTLGRCRKGFIDIACQRTNPFLSLQNQPHPSRWLLCGHIFLNKLVCRSTPLGVKYW